MKLALTVRDLRITSDDLADAEEYAKTLSMEDVQRVRKTLLDRQVSAAITDGAEQILRNALKIHEHDPNFPVSAIEKAKEFLTNPDIEQNPQNHRKLVHEMFIEAALMDGHSPYESVRSVVSNKDDPDLPVGTVRVWVLGIAFVILGAFVNQLFDVRQPRILIEANVAQLLICESTVPFASK